MFAVVVTGAPGAGKTAYLIALTDALVDDEVATRPSTPTRSAWAYPYPRIEARVELLRRAWAAHRDAGHDLLLLGEVVESTEHLAELLEAVGADDHLLVRLTAPYMLLRQRILAREPADWSGLEYLLEETSAGRWRSRSSTACTSRSTPSRTGPHEVAARIRAERPDRLGG